MPLQHSEIAPGVHRLAARYENWYLLEQGKRLTLLDTGLPGNWNAFVSALARLGHSLESIDAVLSVAAVGALDEIADGEVLDVPGSPRVIHAPGHTAGSCALLLEDQSILFSGDALVTLDMTRGRTGPQIIRGPVTEDADMALESLEVLKATKAELVLPGHGEPWREGIESAVRFARGGAA